MKACPNCGTMNADDSRYCTQCGTPLPATERPAEAPPTGAGSGYVVSGHPEEQGTYNPPPPPPPTAAGSGPQPYAPAGVPTRQSSTALWALIFGIASIFTCGLIFGPVAIALGVQARREPPAANRGMADIGLILGIIGTVFAVAAIVFWIIFIATAPGGPHYRGV